MGHFESLDEPLAQDIVGKQEHNYLFNVENLPQYREYLNAGIALVTKTLSQCSQPFSGITPTELATKFQRIDLDKPSGEMQAALHELEDIYLKDAVYFHHPKYVAHLNCPVAYPALLAEQVLSAINSSVDTWDQSAGATLIEQALIDWTISRIGLGTDADGIFTSGGTQSNLMAILLARDAFCNNYYEDYSVKHSGLPEIARRFRIFTSSISHFSVQKSAALLGLGYDAVVSVPVDDQLKMDTNVLRAEIEKCLEEDLLPIAVVATAGTTDFGSIDPLNDIASLCRQHKIWMHVDAAYGCGLLVSPRRRHYLDGIQQADSVTVDYHKSFLQPVSCSAFFARNKTHLETVTHHADYLNPLSAKQEGTPNLVNKSIQTTRRFDALKLWLSLRIIGADKIGEIFDQVCELARSTCNMLKTDKQIDVIHEAELSTVVFRFTAPDVSDDVLDEANKAIRKALFRSGESVVAGTRFNGKQYLKFTLLNPTCTIEDIRYIIETIKANGVQYLATGFCLEPEISEPEMNTAAVSLPTEGPFQLRI